MRVKTVIQSEWLGFCHKPSGKKAIWDQDDVVEACREAPVIDVIVDLVPDMTNLEHLEFTSAWLAHWESREWDTVKQALEGMEGDYVALHANDRMGMAGSEAFYIFESSVFDDIELIEE